MENPIGKPMTRRDMLKTLGCVSAAGLIGYARADFAFAASQRDKRPNIVFILSDDHRWDYMGCAGHPFIDTSNMDRLAREGVLFSNAFVTTSLCSPSRASFLTGQYAHTHDILNNYTPWHNNNITFLELLKNAGYDTAFIGKWHMPGSIPKLRGVDQFVTFTSDGLAQGRYFNCPLLVNGVYTPSRKPYITEELTDYAIDFIDDERSRPFCLYLSHKAPHDPYLPPPELAHLYDHVELGLEKEAHSLEIRVALTRQIKSYCETIVALDRQIGRVLDKLDEMEIAHNTIVVYTSDNGLMWGEHGLYGKGWAYEESIRIPFIVRYPRLTRHPGTTARQMVLNIDLAPSLLSMSGVPIPKRMEGQSFMPVLWSGSSAPGRRAWFYEFFDIPLIIPAFHIPNTNAVRTETHIYIEHGGKRPELFDLVRDPHEMHNLMGTPEADRLLPSLKAMLNEFKRSKRLLA